MDAYDLIKWRVMHFGLDRALAAQRMGIALNSLRAYEEGKRRIPRYIPLVCAAIAKNLPPWELPPHMRVSKEDEPVIAPPVAPVGKPPTKNRPDKIVLPRSRRQESGTA
jgi:hypothetical protein